MDKHCNYEIIGWWIGLQAFIQNEIRLGETGSANYLHKSTQSPAFTNLTKVR